MFLRAYALYARALDGGKTVQMEESIILPVDTDLPTTLAEVRADEDRDEDLADDVEDIVEDSDDDAEADDAAEGFVRYNRAFVAKMSLADDSLKAYYNVIKNTLLGYKGVKSRLSWCNDSYNKGRIRLAKINVRGNSIMLYLALDPARYGGTKYRYRDVGYKKKYEYVPLLLKVRSKRGLGYAVELIADLMAAHHIEAGAPRSAPHAPVRCGLEDLMARNLVRVVGNGVGPIESAATATEDDKAPTLPPVYRAIDTAAAGAQMSDAMALGRLEVRREADSRRGTKRAMVNLDTLSRAFAAGDSVDLQAMRAKHLVPKGTNWIKVCARGTLDKPLVVYANEYSIVAIKMLLLTGGTAVKIK